MLDVLIIGAGPSGLCAAKTFLQHDRTMSILLVDGRASLGGVWSRELLFPTLRTNNLWSSIDFLDFPMEAGRYGRGKDGSSGGIGPGQHVSGEAMHEYLSEYAEHFGVTADKIRLRTRVVEVKRRERGADGKEEGGWSVRVARERDEKTGSGRNENDTDEEEVLECRKLIVATGILNKPHMPNLDGSDVFGGPIVHSSDLGPQFGPLMENPNIKSVAVIGGCKSAYDAVYLAAATGHKVEWIIRKSGRGPTWVFPAHTWLGPFKAWREKLLTRRLVTFMSPWVFGDYSGFGWLRRKIHSSKVGRAVTDKFWATMRADTVHECRFHEDEAFKVLEPEEGPFWYGTATGVLNYDKDIFGFIKSGQVRIHREDISHLAPGAIHLASSLPDGAAEGTTGAMLHVDALIASTGYSSQPNVTFSPPELHSSLGLPSTHFTPAQKRFWSELDLKADLKIGSEFPRLLLGPPTASHPTTPEPFHTGMPSEVPYTAWRLYRGIAPPGLAAHGDRSLVFLGMQSNPTNTIRLDVQCLWALAYMTGKLRIGEEGDSSDEATSNHVFEETALLQRFAQHRAPCGHGKLYPDLTFDQMPYWDMLLNDLGLETRRKGNWARELFEPYAQDDYKGLVAEWIAKNK